MLTELRKRQVGSHYLKTGLSHKILMQVVINKSISGETTAGGLRRMKEYSSLISQL